METKEWIDIPLYSGIYQISSDFSKVKNISTNKVLKGTIYKGHIQFCLYKNKIRKTIGMHQIIYNTFIDSGYIINKNIVIDHKDNSINKLGYKDNNPNNLQLLTNRENCSKDIDKTKTTSKYIGVRFDKLRGKWRSEIKYKGKRFFIGRFECELEAHNAYQSKLFDLNKQENNK